MNADTVLAHLRRFQLASSGFLLIGTLIELVAIGHTEEPLQLVPFVLSGMDLVVVSIAFARPSLGTLLALRVLMIPMALGSLVGVWEHVQGNVAIYREVHATATTTQVIGAALGGRNPLLAPGMLALAGVLAVAATYHHPALSRQPSVASDQAPHTALTTQGQS